MFKLYPDTQVITKPVFDLPGFSFFFKNHTGLEPIKAIDPKELSSPNSCDLIPMFAGKTCYLSFEEGKGRNNAVDHLGNLIKQGHGSVLEHTNIGMILMTSRDISHEIVRHRAGFSYSQLSQRYVNFPQFLCPPELLIYFAKHKHIVTNPDLIQLKFDDSDMHTTSGCPGHIWYQTCEQLNKVYQDLARKLENDLIDSSLTKTEKRKIVNQTARAILPNCTITYIFMTGNVRAWRHTIESRTSRYASTGIRLLFNRVFDQLSFVAPACFQDYFKKTEYLTDGTFEVCTEHPKV